MGDFKTALHQTQEPLPALVLLAPGLACFGPVARSIVSAIAAGVPEHMVDRQ